MPEVCPLCEDSGLRVIERAGNRVAVVCDCRVAKRSARLIEAAKIPQRYVNCTLESYDTDFPSADRSLKSALMQARNFVKAYPLETDGNGLLLTGSIGAGKTHLAIGMLQALIVEKGATGLFVHYLDLLKQVLHSYNRSVDVTEVDILRPVFEADVLVLDELGASKPTDWVWDTVAHILNTRYNDRLTTIITTNYANLGAGQSMKEETRAKSREARDAQNANREQTLGDRIGDRMLSRLQEMCVIVDVHSVDFRTIKRARFG
jgi:DNA replication protein DnaC